MVQDCARDQDRHDDDLSVVSDHTLSAVRARHQQAVSAVNEVGPLVAHAMISTSLADLPTLICGIELLRQRAVALLARNASLQQVLERATNWLDTSGGKIDRRQLVAIVGILSEGRSREGEPVPMLLHCPVCGTQHIDAPDEAAGWTNPPHRSHLCHACGTVWRPADALTVGVASITTRGQRDTWPQAAAAP